MNWVVGGELIDELTADATAVKPYFGAGDALFFHSNTLHRSDQNRSPDRRWMLLCCYNAARNDPYKDSHHPRYTPLAKVPDRAIVETGARRFAADDAAWLDADEAMDARRHPRVFGRLDHLDIGVRR